tara:strand:- start:18536 stop:18886 length:351 start_codon:yes stop_codon:yes gene_type:complete
MKKKILCFDLDGVICKTIKRNYLKAKPNKKVIKLINQLYYDYKIKIYTSRYMGRNNDNVKLAKKQGYKSTFRQLKNWGLNFHELKLGKISYDLIIDDKALGFKKNWYKDIQKILKK